MSGLSTSTRCIRWKIPPSCMRTRTSRFIIWEVFKRMLNLVTLINIFKSQLIGKLQEGVKWESLLSNERGCSDAR